MLDVYDSSDVSVTLPSEISNDSQVHIDNQSDSALDIEPKNRKMKADPCKTANICTENFDDSSVDIVDVDNSSFNTIDIYNVSVKHVHRDAPRENLQADNSQP